MSELAAHVGGELDGDPSFVVAGAAGLSEAGSTDISFYGDPRYRRQLELTRAGAVLVGADVPRKNGVHLIRVANPHLAFARVSALFHPPRKFAPGVAPGAVVDSSAQVHPEATVMAGATVEAGARVGARTVLFPGVYVGHDASVGAGCTLYPNVYVGERCQLGDRVVIHASAVIGADGFGFAFSADAPEGPAHVKVPQAGIVRIEDDVEIGACACVDRATTGETVVGRGTKIDNLVQIAHNVRVGPLCIVCAQAGVSGSAKLGTGVVLAGQAGVVGHIRVGDMAKVGAQSGIASDVPDGAVRSGSPAFEHREWLRASAALPHLSEALKELRALKKRVAALESELRGKEEPER